VAAKANEEMTMAALKINFLTPPLSCSHTTKCGI